MKTVARSQATSPPRTAAVLSPDRLRTLARAVERLGVAGRTDPETIVVTKLSVARGMREPARELESCR